MILCLKRNGKTQTIRNWKLTFPICCSGCAKESAALFARRRIKAKCISCLRKKNGNDMGKKLQMFFLKPLNGNKVKDLSFTLFIILILLDFLQKVSENFCC